MPHCHQTASGNTAKTFSFREMLPRLHRRAGSSAGKYGETPYDPMAVGELVSSAGPERTIWVLVMLTAEKVTEKPWTLYPIDSRGTLLFSTEHDQIRYETKRN